MLTRKTFSLKDPVMNLAPQCFAGHARARDDNRDKG